MKRLHELAGALILSGAQLFVVSCGCSKSQPDRPVTPEKLKVYIPSSVPKMVKKNSTKKDTQKDDFTVVFSDFQNEKYDTLHLEIRDHAEDAFAERWRADTSKKWRKFQYRGFDARERVVTANPGTNPPAATGKQELEVMVGTRFWVGVYTDDEKNRAVLIKSLREIADAVDLAALEKQTAPSVQPVQPSSVTGGTTTVIASTSGTPGASPAAGGGPAGPDESPLAPPPPHPVGKENWLAKRIDLALSKLEDQERTDWDEIVKLARQVKAAGPAGSKTLAQNLDAKKKKFDELHKKTLDARKDLEAAYRNPPKDPNAAATPEPPPKPKEPTLHEKWTAQVAPLLKAPGTGQAILDVITKLPLEERQSVDYHSAAARAYQDLKMQGAAADALLMLSVLTNDPHPEKKLPEIAPVRAWLKKKTDTEFMVAMAGWTNKNPNPQAHAQNIKQAVMAYLTAVKLDAAVLERDDRGLREASLKGLKSLVTKHPERTDLAFLLGVYADAVGESQTATSSFRSYASTEKDPYLKWRAEAFLKKIAPGN